MDPLIGAGLVSAGASLIQNLFNSSSTSKTNKTNEKINKQNLDYQKAMTEASWARDDNAHQREVADLKAAGLSPLANTSGAEVTSPLSVPNPLAMQAPQIDLNSAIEGALRIASLSEEKRHNLKTEGQTDDSIQNVRDQLQHEKDVLQNKKDEFSQSIKVQQDTLLLESDQLAELAKKNANEAAIAKAQYLSQERAREIKRQTGDENTPIHAYVGNRDKDVYIAAYNYWLVKRSRFMESIGVTSYSESQSTAEAVSGEVSAGVGVPGATANAKVGGSHSESQSTSRSEDLSFKQKEEYHQWLLENPQPVWFGDEFEKDGFMKSFFRQ